MPNIIGSILKGLKDFLNFLFLHFREVFLRLWKAKDGIHIKDLLKDTWSVLRSTGMLGILNLIALLVFTVLPQGKDVLLIIAEEVGVEMRFGNLIFLIIGIFFWSVVSEFACRYTIYVTDNSGKSISEERVEWRKTLQKAMADIFLLLPYIIVVIGFLINYLQDDSLTGTKKNLGFGIPALCIYLVLSTVAHFYLDDKKRHAMRSDTGKSSFLNFLLLPTKESDWSNKLYGIYNDYVFNIRKPSNFSGQPLDLMLQFWKNLSADEQRKLNFPKSNEVNPENRVPDEFKFLGFSGESKMSEGQFRWIYRIPLSFYKVLHKQVRVIATSSLVLFLIICFFPLSWYDNIGAPGLVVLAFACYTGMYAGILYIDYALLRRRKISLRFLLVAFLVFSSVFNDDHPVRYNTAGVNDHRPDLKEHFQAWFNEYKKDSNTLYRLIDKNDTASFYPVVFVCAEGGALRTGAFAALTLSFLQDSLASHYDSIDLRKSIYAFSAVSGGSLGVSFFNAASYLSSPQEDFKQTEISANTKTFFNEDYLSPVIGKMFYGELVNLFIPVSIKRFDRAAALEESWEESFGNILRRDRQNIFSANYLQLYEKEHTYPAIFINTTEVESGLSCWLSNVKTDSLILGKQRDLLNYKLRAGINYSTMVNFSSRFPLFSPGAAVKQNSSQKFHYVDGGYVENTGCGTMLEIMQALLPLMKENEVRPYVLVLRYNDDKNAANKNISTANEVSEIISGIYNTRGGRSTMAQKQLEIFVKSLNGKVSVLPLEKTGSQVPMNWVLSARSLSQIESDIKYKWEQRSKNDLQNLLYLDTLNCIMCKKWPGYFKKDTIPPKADTTIIKAKLIN